ncbi:hypothetical protein SAMN05444161_8659 [Rhizobiales bacterium GAS191]|nr:hypothetical protein SAMN05444161_8659 [Rhizobiales bacterium GAS191]
MAYRLYIVSLDMTPTEFESAKPDLPTIELEDLFTALVAAADYLETGLSAVIEGDDGTHLEADEIRAQIAGRNR